MTITIAKDTDIKNDTPIFAKCGASFRNYLAIIYALHKLKAECVEIDAATANVLQAQDLRTYTNERHCQAGDRIFFKEEKLSSAWAARYWLIKL
ncbi:hypothetical protein QT972_25435 [Microcoleus sp. herbarium7]|uniref:hypothetical protein n=1 Tax=Microcoleus sp. herbarium7 TaxID=3055435 RepID=UPI002FD56000